MPPHAKFTAEDVREAAFRLLRAKGMAAVNARSVAEELGCSTQPLFRVYPSMGALLEDLRARVQSYYDVFMDERMDRQDPFRSVGKAHLAFARTEPHLFRLLFVGADKESTPLSQLLGEEADALIPALSAAHNLSEEDARYLYLESGIFIHGLATLLCAVPNCFGEADIDGILDTALQSFLTGLKAEEGWFF